MLIVGVEGLGLKYTKTNSNNWVLTAKGIFHTNYKDSSVYLHKIGQCCFPKVQINFYL